MDEPEERNEADRLIETINSLSDDAVYILTLDYFTMVILYKPILAAAANERQREAFEELMSVGFVYLDTERGHVGFRSSDRGRKAAYIVKSARAAQ